MGRRSSPDSDQRSVLCLFLFCQLNRFLSFVVAVRLRKGRKRIESADLELLAMTTPTNLVLTRGFIFKLVKTSWFYFLCLLLSLQLAQQPFSSKLQKFTKSPALNPLNRRTTGG